MKSESFSDNKIIQAVQELNPEKLRALIESGESVEILNDSIGNGETLVWKYRRNLLPEIEHLEDFNEREQKELLKISARLKNGREILKILADHDSCVSLTNKYSDIVSDISLIGRKTNSTVYKETLAALISKNKAINHNHEDGGGDITPLTIDEIIQLLRA